MNKISEQNTLLKEHYPVQGMSCASCVASVESILQTQLGVEEASVNFAANSVLITYDPDIIQPQDFKRSLQKIGYDLTLEEDTRTSPDSLESINSEQASLATKVKLALILALPVFLIEMFWSEQIPWAHEISFVLTTVLLLVPGKRFFINAWKQTRYGRANMDTLVALSVGIAFLYSVFNLLFPAFLLRQGMQPVVYFESAAVIIAFILLGRYLEERAKQQSGEAIQALMHLQPKKLTVIRNGEEMEIPASEVKTYDRVLIRPADRVPVDGKVIRGDSYVDESMITGEPIPKHKQKNDLVHTGTINQQGTLTVLAEKVGNETVLAQIIQVVREAQGSKAPVQKLVDRIAGIFVPVVLVVALFTLFLWLWMAGTDYLHQALMASISVLVIACPCALGLATPTAIMVGIGKGAKQGILIKNAESLENFRKIDTLLLDKTGTITEGHLRVEEAHWFTEESAQTHQALIYSIEKKSEHPIGQAIANYFKNLDLNLPSDLTLDKFENRPGQGITAAHQGQSFYLGNSRLLQAQNISIPSEAEQISQEATSTAKTCVYFADQDQLIALIILSDQIRAQSYRAIQSFQNQGIGVWVLSGDQKSTVRAISQSVGIRNFQGEMMPQDKADFVRKCQAQQKNVAMVGDGINDAEALALADTSVAMGQGTDITLDVAGITLVRSDLEDLWRAFLLSKATSRTIRQNLFWAFIYNLICIPVAAGVLYPINGFLLTPMLAGAAMAFSSVSVVLNSLRLR